MSFQTTQNLFTTFQIFASALFSDRRLVYDLECRSATTSPFEASDSVLPLKQGLLYGSTTKDFNRNFYVVGSFYSKRIPIMLQVSAER